MDSNPHKGVNPDQTQYNPGFSMVGLQKKINKLNLKKRNK